MFPSFLFVNMILPSTSFEILLWNLIGKLTVDPGSILTLSSSIEKSEQPSSLTQYEIGFLDGLLSSIFFVTKSPRTAGKTITSLGM